MNLTALIVQLIGGALGGYGAGNVSKEINLGTIGSAIVGALGGGVGGQVLFTLLGLSGTVQVVSALLTGAVSGGLATLLIRFLKSKIPAKAVASIQRIGGFGARIEELSTSARTRQAARTFKAAAFVTDPAGNSRLGPSNGMR
jgi:hypothetical protein